MKLRILLSFVMAVVFSYSNAQNQIWNRIDSKTVVGLELLERTSQPETFYLYSLNLDTLKDQLHNAPKRNSGEVSNVIVPFPTGNGTIKYYRVYRADVVHPELAAKYGNLKSFVGQDVNNASSIIRFSITTFGLHTMTQSVDGTSYIDPYTKDQQYYISYKREGLITSRTFRCDVTDNADIHQHEKSANQPMGVASDDGILRTYRLALACTIEYAAFHIDAADLNDGTLEEQKEAVLAAMVVTITRVNSIYEIDLSITLQLIPENEDIIFVESDDFTNSNEGNALLFESQIVIDNIIGSENYDIGHTVSTGGGGIAQLYSPCSGNKARGITGLPSPVGDPYDVDYVAHEMGHQFGGRHSFNNSCNGNRSNATAYEPGSGSTIMAYAGICPPNVQSNSDAHFHAFSIAEMSAFIADGGDCGENEVTGNIAPVADAGEDYIIPFSTPFILSGRATDANDDDMTYNWEQLDNEISEQPPLPTNIEGPNFRSLPSKEVPERYMPDIVDVLNNNLTPTWEVVSSVSREFNFAFTVRDNNVLGGQVSSDVMNVTVSGVAGPFIVTTPNTDVSWQAGTNKNVTWDVAGTTENGVDAAYVDIYLSTDGGLTYPIVLASKVPNDGSEIIAVPNMPGTDNRIMVKGYEHIFYDLSNTDFTITEPEATMAIDVSGDQNLADCITSEVTYILNYNAYNGFDDETSFSVIGAPEGSTITFTPETADEDGTVIMAITTAAGTAAGFYSITVEATSGSITKNINVYLELIEANFGTINLLSPENEEITVFNQTTFDWSDATGATGYEIEIATDEDFDEVIINTIVPQSTYTLLLDDSTQYFWRVRPVNDTCPGVYGETSEFTTGITECNDYVSADVPVSISNTSQSIVNSTITITDDVPVQNITVSVDIAHTWVSDLTATLISPEGTEVQLFSDDCDNENNIDAIFDDTGNESECNGDPVISGIILPDELLSAFDGESTEGTWTLEVIDEFNEDGGAINGWSLNICTTAPIPVGSSDVFDSNTFIVYPNPNDGQFTIKYTSGTGSDIKVIVHDVRGRKILNDTFTNNGLIEQSLSLQNAEAGIYLVTVQDADNRITRKIIVQ